MIRNIFKIYRETFEGCLPTLPSVYLVKGCVWRQGEKQWGSLGFAEVELEGTAIFMCLR